MSEGASRRQRAVRVNARNDVTDALKVLLDSGVVPIAFLGTELANGMFRRNLQLSSPRDICRAIRFELEIHRLYRDRSSCRPA